MRCNLFSQLDPKSPAAKNLREHMLDTLPRYFPVIYEKTGDIELASPVQLMPTQMYRLKNFLRDRLVILGDEFQSVDPATGSGFTKILTDINLLVRKYIPRWTNENDFSRNQISKFYCDKDKLQSDINSLQQWIYYYKKANHRNDIPIKVKQRILSHGYFFILKYL